MASVPDKIHFTEMVCRKECGRENKCGVWEPKKTKIKYRAVRENACRSNPEKDQLEMRPRTPGGSTTLAVIPETHI